MLVTVVVLLETVLLVVAVKLCYWCQRRPVPVEYDAQMHHGQNKGEAKTYIKQKCQIKKIGEFINFAEIGGIMQNASMT